MAVAHGFRSTFRDWCGEASRYPTDLAEAALAHINKDKTEAAYARSDLFAKRAVLMADWAAFCGNSATEVVPMPLADNSKPILDVEEARLSAYPLHPAPCQPNESDRSRHGERA